RGPRQPRVLDGDEAELAHHLVHQERRLRADPHRPRDGVAAHVEVPVLEPDLLVDVDVALDGERQRRGLRQHLDVGGGDLDLPGRQLGVLVALGPDPALPGDLDAELRAQVVRGVLLTEHHLRGARGVPQVDERDAAVVAAAADPAGQRDLLPGVLPAERARLVGADHFESLSFNVVTMPVSGTAACPPSARSLTWATPSAMSRSPRITA